MSSWTEPDPAGVAGAAPLVSALAGAAGQRWLQDDQGRLAVSVGLKAFGSRPEVRVSWRPAAARPGPGERLILLTDATLQPHALGALIDAFQRRQDDVAYIAAPGLQAQALAPGSEDIGEIRVAGNALALCRIAPAPRAALRKARHRSIEPIGDRELEGPGHLEGRSRWFRHRHKGKD